MTRWVQSVTASRVNHSQSMDDETHPPVNKAGAVVVRHLLQGKPEILIVRPKPKNEGELPRYVLPRGTRQYWEMDAHGEKQWIDARTQEAAISNAANLEPMSSTMLRELHEEGGITPAMTTDKSTLVYDLGVKEFESTSKGNYPVHWFVVVPEAETLRHRLRKPDDAMETRWATLKEIEDMAEQDMFSPGYVPVIREALTQMLQDKLPLLDMRGERAAMKAASAQHR